MSCPCDVADSYRSIKKGIVFAVIQKLMETKIIKKVENAIPEVETGKIAKGKTMKFNLMAKTLVYVISSYVIDMFKSQILQIKSIENISFIKKDGKLCFCILEDIIIIIVLQLLSVIYHKKFKGKDLLNNIISVYGSSYLYDMYGKKYLGYVSDALPSVVGEKTSTSTTNQGGQVRTNINEPDSAPGQRAL
jgi:hypothetical protein